MANVFLEPWIHTGREVLAGAWLAPLRTLSELLCFIPEQKKKRPFDEPFLIYFLHCDNFCGLTWGALLSQRQHVVAFGPVSHLFRFLIDL